MRSADTTARLHIVAFDIANAKRLRRAARTCLDFGERLQRSVFACYLMPAELRTLSRRLRSVIDAEADSVRLYAIGEEDASRMRRLGRTPGVSAPTTCA